MPIVSVFLTMLVCSALVMIFGTEVWMVIFPSLSSQWESFSVKAMGLTTNNTPGELYGPMDALQKTTRFVAETELQV